MSILATLYLGILLLLSGIKLVPKVTRLEMASFAYSRYKSAHQVTLACSCLIIITAFFIFYWKSFSTGFFFDYVLYLGSIYGDSSFILAPINIISVFLPLVFFGQRGRRSKILQTLIILFFASIIFIELNYADPELSNYRQGWSFGMAAPILPEKGIMAILSRLGLWLAGGTILLRTRFLK